jgi:hypothetical protein
MGHEMPRCSRHPLDMWLVMIVYKEDLKLHLPHWYKFVEASFIKLSMGRAVESSWSAALLVPAIMLPRSSWSAALLVPAIMLPRSSWSAALLVPAIGFPWPHGTLGYDEGDGDQGECSADGDDEGTLKPEGTLKSTENKL